MHPVSPARTRSAGRLDGSDVGSLELGCILCLHSVQGHAKCQRALQPHRSGTAQHALSDGGQEAQRLLAPGLVDAPPEEKGVKSSLWGGRRGPTASALSLLSNSPKTLQDVTAAAVGTLAVVASRLQRGSEEASGPARDKMAEYTWKLVS